MRSILEAPAPIERAASRVPVGRPQLLAFVADADTERALRECLAHLALPQSEIMRGGIAKGGQSGNTLSVFNPNETSLNTVFNGILFAILLFVGFEAAASETRVHDFGADTRPGRLQDFDPSGIEGSMQHGAPLN